MKLKNKKKKMKNNILKIRIIKKKQNIKYKNKKKIKKN